MGCGPRARHANVSTAISERAVRTFDLGTYIGSRVSVDEETYGTVCFADGDERASPFTDAESHFVELLARLVGQAIERRRYERELDERERRLDERAEVYRAVVDASFDLVFRIDTEGRFTYVSSPVEELLGYPREQYVGRSFAEMLPDEETVLVDVRVTPIYEGSVPPDERTAADVVAVQGTAREATERRRRRPAHNLAEAARKLEENLETAPELDPIDERYPNASVTVNVPGSAVARTAPRLETAVWEPLDNAAKHAGEHPDIELNVTQRKGRVVIVVSDDGPGLPDIERSVIATGEETPLAHGTGLGLWLVHWIVESLDGDIRVSDAESTGTDTGTGTAVEIRLHGVETAGDTPGEGDTDGPDRDRERRGNG